MSDRSDHPVPDWTLVCETDPADERNAPKSNQVPSDLQGGSREVIVAKRRPNSAALSRHIAVYRDLTFAN
jgi:hypothetical protein